MALSQLQLAVYVSEALRTALHAVSVAGAVITYCMNTYTRALISCCSATAKSVTVASRTYENITFLSHNCIELHLVVLAESSATSCQVSVLKTSLNKTLYFNRLLTDDIACLG
jgi:hypothetical protein